MRDEEGLRPLFAFKAQKWPAVVKAAPGRGRWAPMGPLPTIADG